MLETEAERLREILLGRDVSPLLNLGSSTLEFRRAVQPHIERALFAPLARAGIAVVHCDLAPGPGVDVAGDVRDPATVARLKAGGFRCVLAANLIEHVRERARVAAACEEIVGPGGLILATVPRSYPYHADPIDTRYRPSPAELAALFRRSEAVLAEELTGPTFAEDLVRRGVSPWRELARTAAALLLAPVRPRSAAARLDRWRWWQRPYRVSIALLRVQ